VGRCTPVLDVGQKVKVPYDHLRVEKMSFAKVRDSQSNKLVADRSKIIYNSRITLGGVPDAA
jgi:predicted helicase